MERARVVRVLGPIDVMTPSGAVSVGGRRTRALLGSLAIAAGRAVSIDHLQEVLWSDDAPRAVENTLQSHVSELRHVLGAGAVILTDHSYALARDVVDVDAQQFEALLRRANEARNDPETAWAMSHDALGLWRGRPFGDLSDDECFRLEAYRLDQLRLVAMELSLEADLALGRHELVIGELESSVEEHPYSERLWLLLIEALARSGRRVEALRACARLRALLDEVGIEPGSEVCALERLVLRGEPVATPADADGFRTGSR